MCVGRGWGSGEAHRSPVRGRGQGLGLGLGLGRGLTTLPSYASSWCTALDSNGGPGCRQQCPSSPDCKGTVTPPSLGCSSGALACALSSASPPAAGPKKRHSCASGTRSSIRLCTACSCSAAAVRAMLHWRVARSTRSNGPPGASGWCAGKGRLPSALSLLEGASLAAKSASRSRNSPRLTGRLGGPSPRLGCRLRSELPAAVWGRVDESTGMRKPPLLNAVRSSTASPGVAGARRQPKSPTRLVATACSSLRTSSCARSASVSCWLLRSSRSSAPIRNPPPWKREPWWYGLAGRKLLAGCLFILLVVVAAAAAQRAGVYLL